MYPKRKIDSLIQFISERDGCTDKKLLSAEVQTQFQLTKARSVYFCEDFAIRFCKGAARSFSNTVLALSALHQYDKTPFFVCLVTPDINYLMLANATFLKKISHSSQELRVDNIKGSFNGGDIMREYGGLENCPKNFEELFAIHENFSFMENLERLVESTNQIVPSGKRFEPTDEQRRCICASVDRAADFLQSKEYQLLQDDLNARVNAVASEIAIAAFIDNVNLRGRIIEYLITAEDDLKHTLMDCLRENRTLPEIYTSDDLGDYGRDFARFRTQTDIKTKVLFLSGNPKGYNIDKLLTFLAEEHSVYLVYVVAIDSDRTIQTRLCSMFNRQLLDGTKIIKHWAGRNSRGVTQYEGKALEQIVEDFDPTLDPQKSLSFLEKCML